MSASFSNVKANFHFSKAVMDNNKYKIIQTGPVEPRKGLNHSSDVFSPQPEVCSAAVSKLHVTRKHTNIAHTHT